MGSEAADEHPHEPEMKAVASRTAGQAVPPRTRRLGTASGYLMTVVIVAATTAIGWGARTWIGVPDIEMLFLLAVVVSAARWGRGPAITAAALSVVAYDVFLVPPHFTLAVADAKYLLTFAVMFGAGYWVSSLTEQIRKQEHEAKLREEHTAALAWEARQAALLAKTEKMRSALLSSVSHDLRTPLAAITGAATTLRHEPLDEATRRELTETICEEALEEIVGGALTRLESKLGSRTVSTSLQPDLPMVPVDPVLMQQLFVNLFENAAKYTPPGTSIEVTAVRDGASVVVEVIDHGPGLPEGEEELVFERFHRGPHAVVPGAGLGLAICRGIAQAHGGSLSACNEPGAGACFRLMIPVQGTPPVMPPDEPAEERT